VQQKASLRRYSSYSHLLLRPLSSGCSHSQETQLVLACGAPMDNQLLLHDRPWRSVPGGLTTTHLLRGSSKALHLTSWLGPTVKSAKDLPLDSLCHEVSDLIEEIHVPPLASTDLVALPLSRIPSVTYHALRAPLLQSLLADWLDLSPPVPLSYPYSVCLTPHAFTGLPRFKCGRIHQMSTGASYLAPHVSWWSRDSSTLCPLCEEDDDSFQHAILLCPAKAQPHLTHLSGVDNIGPDGLLGLSLPLLRGLAEYLYSTHTCFPPTMLHIRANTATPEPGSGSDSA